MSGVQGEWGAVARESRWGREPHAERAEEGGLTLGGWRGRELASSPPRRAGARAVSRGSVRRRSSQDRRTGGRRRRPRPPQPRLWSRRCRIAGLRCRRRRRAGGRRAAQWAARAGQDRYARRRHWSAPRPPPAPTGHRAVPIVTSLAGGRGTRGLMEKLGRNLRAHGGRGRDGSERAAPET